MRRSSATAVLLLASCACLGPLALTTAASATVEHKAKHAGKIATTKVASAHHHGKVAEKGEKKKPAEKKIAAASREIPLPDRNPHRPADAVAANGDGAFTTGSLPLPERNPDRPQTQTPPPFALKGPVDPSTPQPVSAPVAVPKPGMDYASVLKPILSYNLGPSDEANLKNAVAAGFRGDTGSAQAAIAKIGDPAARKLATWLEYRNGGGGLSADAIEQFRNDNADWPDQDTLRGRAETALFLGSAGPEQIHAFFGASQPLTGSGKAALASAFAKEGDAAAARTLIVSAWRDYKLSAAIEKKILDRFGDVLTPDDHRARIDRLLYSDAKSDADAALRIAKLLPGDEQKKVQARIAAINGKQNAGKLFDAVPASLTNGDVGLFFNKIQWLRHKDRDEEAWKMLLAAPVEPDQLLDLDEWWAERRVNCRAALNAGEPRIAYEIALKHGPISGSDYMEAEFLAGWIALRFLNEPNTALSHFLALRTAANTSKNIARAEYWLGRTSLALGDNNTARVHFHAAARYPQHFYGQLGRQALDPQPANLAVTPTPLPTQADIQRFLSRDAVRAIGISMQTDMDRLTPLFFISLARQLKSPQEVVLLAELAKLSDNPQIALRLSKIAFNRDLPVGEYALPVGVLPQFKSLLSERLDPALVHALSRQESEFNAGAKSSVGASGLMQLMPMTAKAVAKQYKVKFEVAELTNPAYNVQLGEAHLSGLVDSYSGSYFLALAAYNAGGGRVQEWMSEFGDPRDPNVDPVDWIERIPFTETREYVQKIMEALQLYRSRLSGPQQALQLVQDLNRGRKTQEPPASTTAALIQVNAKSE